MKHRSHTTSHRIFLPLILFASLLASPICAVQPKVTKKQADPFVEKSITYTGGPFKNETFRYRLLKPKTIEKGKTYPLILFLHGAGERGNDNQKQTNWLGRYILDPELHKKFPCFVLAPQCRPKKRWVEVPWDAKKSSPLPAEPSDMMKMAIACLQKTVQESPIDIDRIYLTGASMGGYGTWDLAMRHPHWFAAVAPVCGGGDERKVHRLLATPVWAFHGSADRVVWPVRSRTLVNRLKQLGHTSVKYTELPGVGHNSWSYAYRKDNVIPWLMQHSRKNSKAVPAGIQALTGKTSPLQNLDIIAFLGDTITKDGLHKTGFVGMIQSAVKTNLADKKIEIRPVVVGGGLLPHLHKEFPKKILAAGATTIVIYPGTYDVWSKLLRKQTPKDKYRRLLEDIVSRSKKAGLTVILATPAVIGEQHDGNNKLDKDLNEFSQISRDLAAKHGVYLLNLRHEFIETLKVQNPANRSMGIFTYDRTRMSDQGNRLLADLFGRAIYEALQENTQKMKHKNK